MKRLVLVAGLLLLAQGVQAQERRVEETDLPRWVADDVIDFFNDPNTIRFAGRSRIPSTRMIRGDVASLGGPFLLAGEIDGDLVVSAMNPAGRIHWTALMIGYFACAMNQKQSEVPSEVIIDSPVVTKKNAESFKYIMRNKLI